KNPPLINYLQRLSKKHKDNDMRYGIRRKHGELHMGDSPISFANDTISIKGKNYPITPGLLELLFRKSPDDALITPDDKDKYLDIIQHTNTHRKNYDPNRSIYEDITIKYNKYVADFLTKFGKGLPKHMIARKQRLPMDYVYWDDPNELVDRLRLLMASQAAGNPSHTNEIIIDIFGRPLDNDKSVQRGPAGRGFNITSDGNYNIESKRLCNLGNPSNEHDAATVQFVLRQMSDLNKSIDMIAEELHKPARRNYKRRHVDIRGLDETWQADLVEMIPYATVNKGYKYLLTIIDIFSKYAWAVPIKSKSGVDVTSAMKSVLQQGRIPKNLHVDQGKEFYNKEFKDLMKQHKINLYSTFSNLKASICERFNRTLKTKMWREFTNRGSYKWADTLDDLVNTYNSTIHSTIKMKPADVTAPQEKQLLENIYQPLKTKSKQKQKFKVGDKVRISK
ncbi:GSCOCG00013064001-RA-CDS, partial [Cotesia congregata]